MVKRECDILIMKFFRFILIGLAVLVVIVALTVVVEKFIPSTRETGEKTVESIPLVDETSALMQIACEESGGTWNGCGSACRNDPSAPCIQVCVAYCECSSDAQCPANFACGQYVDSVGICS